MTNLVQEIIKTLAEHKKKEADILWCGNHAGTLVMKWGVFKERFAGVDYDSGFGSPEIAIDLVVVGVDWWLQREEYDGAEWFSFNALPQGAREFTAFVKVDGGMWNKLIELQDEQTTI